MEYFLVIYIYIYWIWFKIKDNYNIFTLKIKNFSYEKTIPVMVIPVTNIEF